MIFSLLALFLLFVLLWTGAAILLVTGVKVINYFLRRGGRKPLFSRE